MDRSFAPFCSLVADPKTVAEYIQAADKEATVCNFVRIKLGE